MPNSIKRILLFTCLVSLLSCKGDSSKPNVKVDSIEQTVDSTRVVVFTNLDENSWVYEHSAPSTLSIDETEQIDEILKICIDTYNVQAKREFDSISRTDSGSKFLIENFIINLSRYKRQYIPMINKNGEKEVWVNCFCSSWDMDWRKHIIAVKDGGNCFFNVLINLPKKKWFDLTVNGSV